MAAKVRILVISYWTLDKRYQVVGEIGGYSLPKPNTLIPYCAPQIQLKFTSKVFPK